MKPNLAKVQSIEFVIQSQVIEVVVLYPSGTMRTYSFTHADFVTLQSLVDAIEASGRPMTAQMEETKAIIAAYNQQVTPASTDLSTLLGLTPAQVADLKGTDRLNFWWRGPVLNMQIGHGSRATKVVCAKPATATELNDLFTLWGWQQLSGKAYFKPVAGSSVRL